jgi:hypothetical protein
LFFGWHLADWLRLMKLLMTVFLLALLFCNACKTPQELVSQGTLRLQFDDASKQNFDIRTARVYVDNKLVGSFRRYKPVLKLSPGKHRIRIEVDGAKPVEETVTIQPPNKQKLRIRLSQ